MKKIRNTKHIKKEKERLLQRQQGLEAAIRNDWKAVKDAVQDGTLVKDSLTAWVSRKTVAAIAGNSIVRSSLLLGATMLVSRLLTGAIGKKKKSGH